jgi:hypothetical protein
MPNTQYSRSLWVAILVAPLAAPVAYTLWELVVALFMGGAKDHDLLLVMASVLMVSFALVLLASYIAALIFALPLVLWLRARGILTTAYVCIGSALAGLIVGAVFPAILGFGWRWVVQFSAYGVFLGLLSGICLCLVAGITTRPSGRRTGAA